MQYLLGWQLLRFMGDRRVAKPQKVWDTEYDTEGESEYECYGCGYLVCKNGTPVTCPECGGTLRNRDMPIE